MNFSLVSKGITLIMLNILLNLILCILNYRFEKHRMIFLIKKFSSKNMHYVLLHFYLPNFLNHTKTTWDICSMDSSSGNIFCQQGYLSMIKFCLRF